MKILFLGDYSNLHACLAAELRGRGHEVTVVSDGGRYMRTEADVRLDRHPGAWGTMRYMADIARIWPRLKGYDVVQLINPHFAALRPGRLRPLLKKLKNNNGSLFLTLAGDDHFFVKACTETRTFRFSEYRAGTRRTEFVMREPARESGWMLPEVADFNREVYDMVNGAMSVLPEYDMVGRPLLGDRLVFTNIPIDLNALPYTPLPELGNGQLRILIGMRKAMEVQKGTARMAKTVGELARRNPRRFALETVNSIPLAEYLQRVQANHIVLDQLYSYSPATNALQTMALGRIAGSGGQPEFYRAIGWTGAEPVLKLDPLTDIEDSLWRLIRNPEDMAQRSLAGRRLVEQNNDVRIVARRFEEHWQNILSRTS
ncbi:MAG: hypothetical protein K2J92_05260 [Muribaculaceae bacterium]|nr:hypothetical protein [Bacteroides sp.]MDE6680744.1 hypothetical protein [Muribaculaceae bacterium]MDE6842961.1 hypothetical protein [Muribaculaceae bacterium]